MPEYDYDHDLSVLRVTGELDGGEVSDLKQQIDDHTQSFTLPLVIDLSGVDYLPSLAVSALVFAIRRADQRGGSVQLVAGEGTIAERVLAVSGVPHRRA